MTAAVGVGGVITPAQYAGGGGGGAVSSVFGRSGSVVATTGDYTYAQVGADQSGAAAAALVAAEAFTTAGFAPLASPALTGTPTAPTATAGDTSTQLATDAFVAAAVTAAVQGAPPWEASDAGWLAQNFDPAMCNGSGIPSSTYIYLMRVNIRAAMSITNVILYLTAAGSTLTASECYAGLFSSTGALLGATADQSTSWSTAGNNNTYRVMALAGGPYNVSAGFVWVGFLWNGTTGPTFLRWVGAGGGPQMNPGLTLSTARAANNVGSQTSLASITPGNNAFNSSMYFAAVS